MQVADQPAPIDLAHDVLDRVERGRLANLVEHREKDARRQLQYEHQQCERAEEVPDVEVLRRVVARQLIRNELIERQALVEPSPEALAWERIAPWRQWLTRRPHIGSMQVGHHAAPL